MKGQTPSGILTSPVVWMRSTIESPMKPLSSGGPLWYYAAAVSVLAAAVGLFGMISALSANRRLVKAFEAFYVLSLLTQFGLVIWALIWCKQKQTAFDQVCTASKEGLYDLPVPAFASDWSCQKIFTAGILTIGIGGIIWIGFNFYMTNRVIRYARELFEEKANRYKVISEAAAKELDREQQIPLNYTNIGRSGEAQDDPRSAPNQQASFRDEIEYKDPAADAYQHSRVAPAGFGSYGHDLPQQHQSHHQQHQQMQQHPIAPGFNPRDSTQGIDLVNPNYGEQDIITVASPSDPVPPSISYQHQGVGHSEPAPPSAPYQQQGPGHSEPAPPSAPYQQQGAGQSFVHTSTKQIISPFEEDEPVAQATSPKQGDSKAQ
ncbi:MAG: hypothetical protein J3Q66DRAFT_61509 [Benniella sp.]|nr:MAG: hypothetical protein J3Q66DRAFT_61509 [Benniella sp.]